MGLDYSRRNASCQWRSYVRTRTELIPPRIYFLLFPLILFSSRNRLTFLLFYLPVILFSTVFLIKKNGLKKNTGTIIRVALLTLSMRELSNSFHDLGICLHQMNPFIKTTTTTIIRKKPWRSIRWRWKWHDDDDENRSRLFDTFLHRIKNFLSDYLNENLPSWIIYLQIIFGFNNTANEEEE